MENEQKTDVLIAGAGPAGLAAAIWCHDLGIDFRIFEKAQRPGGQLAIIHNRIANYPGFIADNGEVVLKKFLTHAESLQIEIEPSIGIASVDGISRIATLSTGDTVRFRFLVMATGVSRRRLGVPGESEFLGKGILLSGKKEALNAAGKRVVVVGGGDAACENALILAEHADSVTLLVRSERLRARGEFTEEIAKRENIVVNYATRVKEFGGDGILEWIQLDGKDNSGVRLQTDFAIVRIGVEPNSAVRGCEAKKDSAGYLEVDCHGRTSCDWLFAIGDVANPVSPTISTAAGTASSAIKAISLEIRDAFAS
ncbi:MAG: NAD(P)/FAD-dependent oxidoreductase [Pyrinomonadaceae bacterium]